MIPTHAVDLQWNPILHAGSLLDAAEFIAAAMVDDFHFVLTCQQD
jgi:hypothetical protein